MLSLNQVTVSYKNKTVINALTFNFEDNKIYAMVGKSGSGKSTLIKAIAQILPHEGSISLGSEHLNYRIHRLAFIPQNNSLIRWKKISYNIMFPVKNRGHFDVEEMEKICSELGILHLLSKYPNHISGGEVQRVAIARAFFSKPDLLLMDEPFSALDTITRGEVHAVFRNTYEHHKITTLLITHDIEEALFLAETIIIFKEGQIAKVVDNPYYNQSRDSLGCEYVAMKKELVACL